MSHNNGQVKNKKIMFIAFVLTAVFAILEVVFGLITNSLALLSEGIHMFSDGINLFMSFAAIAIGMKVATKQKTFGFRRVETITAFLNGLALMIIPIFIFIEAIQRFNSPRVIEGNNMLLIACIGLVVNLVVAVLLFKGDQTSLNVRAAALHVLSDLLSSVSTIIAAILIMKLGWVIVDPIISSVVSISIFIGGLHITKEAFNCLMEGTPEDVNIDEVEKEILSVGGVANIDDLKIWSISSGVNYMNVHVKVDQFEKHQDVLTKLKEIADKHDLHATIQIEK